MIKNSKLNNRKIVVGMSGGVDSSVSLVLLKEQGWEPVGVSLKYAVWPDKENLLRENVCCSAESFNIAKSVCEKLKIPHHIVDVSREFKKEVINYFVRELKSGRTPNPCVVCNRRLKFPQLFKWAKKHNIKYVAIGHYADTRRNKRIGKYELAKAKDKKKDQTYSLSFLRPEWLENLVFPLAKLTKSDVYEKARKSGFGIFLKKKQSQDFCFVAGNCLNCFLGKEIGIREGLVRDIKGSILGRHQGIHFYTIGQRRGINLPGGKPYYVVGMEKKKNILIVSGSKKDLLKKGAILSPFNLLSGDKLKGEISVNVKIRSHHAPADAILKPAKEKQTKIIFNKPQKAITPGQFAVFYKRGVCLGGGRIIEVF